jgi:methionine-rich copper-binding protein CopC
MPLFTVRGRRLAAIATARKMSGRALLVASVCGAPLAFRHIGLASSVPAKDSHLAVAPRELRLTFTGRVDVRTAGVELVGSDNKVISLDSLRSVVDSPRVATAQIAGPVGVGPYTVRWHAIALDGAAGNGSFNFTYMPAARDRQ